MTLPESTLCDLQLIDPDRARAIVKLAKEALRGNEGLRPTVAIIEVANKTGLVVVGPSQALRRIPFVHLIQIKPARFLLALEPGKDFNNLEIALNDILDDLARPEKQEREMILELVGKIRALRKTGRVRMAQILFVDLQESDLIA